MPTNPDSPDPEEEEDDYCQPPITHQMQLAPKKDQVLIDCRIWQCKNCSYQVVRLTDELGQFRLHD
jgi:hypothetical protein